ncbi:hypothetical protein OPT61_g5303 [Boeremia exigua]|uniref:Uncharacterized protein n=1 Tax=Boeremia exigua TaxID=749465 RepID=A0ACC2IAZ0_9PLEO|nr:hypothetical protein OPT61_g5303 [Boeremia exigua]
MSSPANESIRNRLAANPDSKWGFVIFRCTYHCNKEWEQFMTFLNAHVRAQLESEELGDCFDRLDWNVQEDPRYEGMIDDDVRVEFRKWIDSGEGFCGSVWALEENHNDAHMAIKREDGGPGRSTPALNIAFDTTMPPTSGTDKALISERIPKVPRAISDKIVDLFCAGNNSLADFVKHNPDDDYCLIRPYLGRRRRHHQGGRSSSRFQRFSLRNVPLHVDQMEALGLDTRAYATAMADALALMHWGAQIDANDVEFVLAPPRASETLSTAAFRSDYLGTHSMWILDFDCCRPLSMDEAGVEQACAAFFKNDPFYPRPGSDEAADEELWTVFRQRVLRTSRRILEQKSEGDVLLAEKLVQRIEEKGVSRRSGRDC